MFTENDLTSAVAYNHHGCGGCTTIIYVYIHTSTYTVYVSTCRFVIVIIPWTGRAGGGTYNIPIHVKKHRRIL